MRKIVIIEDNAVVARLYEKKLSAAGNEVHVAFDGEQGLKMIYDLRPDLVLLDLMLPGRPGIEIIKKIRGDFRYTSLPIMAYSSADEDVLAQAVEAGSTTIMSKNESSFKDILNQFNQLMELSRTWQIYDPRQFPEDIANAAGFVDPEFLDPTLLDCETLKPIHITADPEQDPDPEFPDIIGYSEPDEPVAPAMPKRSNNRLLIIEDDLLTACVISGISEAEGFTPVALEDGQDAYDLLRADNDFAAAVIDIELPSIRGTEILKFMRADERLRHIPAILMTGSSDYIKLQIESYASGATCFLSKPFQRSMVESLFRTVLKK